MNPNTIINFIQTLLPLTWAHKIEPLIAPLLFLVSPKTKTYYNTAIKHALPHLTAKKSLEIAQKSITEIYKNRLFYNELSQKHPHKIETQLKKICIIGQEKIPTILDQKRPILIITVHLSHYLLGLLKLAQTTPSHRPITVIKWHEPSKKEEAVYKKFEEHGIQLNILRLRNKPAIQALKTLKKGHILVILSDIDPHLVDTTTVHMFNQPTRFASGPAQLAIASKALILPIVTHPIPNNRFALTIHDPIDSQIHSKSTHTYLEKTEFITQHIATIVEKWIRQYPHQWESWPILLNRRKQKR